MKFPTKTRSFLVLLASAFLLSTAATATHADDFVRQVKVKDHKVKVKTFNGKAKIKDKPNGKHKVKVKGPTGDIAADIARNSFYGPPMYCSK